MDSRSVAIPLLLRADGALDHPASLLLSAPARGGKGRRFPGVRLRVHDGRSTCSRYRSTRSRSSDLRVHDEVIRAFTMDRNPQYEIISCSTIKKGGSSGYGVGNWIFCHGGI